MDAEVVEPAEGTIVRSVTSTNGLVEKRTQLITWFLGFGFLAMIVSYAALGIYSVARPTEVQGAWEIVTNAQKDIKEILLIVVGILGGAVTQRHQ